MSPWLSVIMPIHRGERFLASTLASAAAEEPAGVEFIVYDSGADHGASQRIAKAFEGLLSIVWHDTPDMAPWTAKTNRGVAEACAPYVAMLHQDDLWLPGHLSALKQITAASPAAALSIGPSLFIGPSGRTIGKWRLPWFPGIYRGAKILEPLLVQNSIAIPSVIIRRDAFLDVGGMEESLWYTADWDLYLKLAEAGDVAVRSETTTAFRLHGHSLTMTGSRDLSDFRCQHERVLDDHGRSLKLCSRDTERRARASVAVNCALAAAANGKPGDLVWSVLSLFKLGPFGLVRYLRQSRILDRLLPRLKLALARAA